MSTSSSSPHKLSPFPGMFYFFYNFDSHFFALTLSKSHVNVGIDLEKLGPGIDSLPKNKNPRNYFLSLIIYGKSEEIGTKKRPRYFSELLLEARTSSALCNPALKREGKSYSRTFWVLGNQCRNAGTELVVVVFGDRITPITCSFSTILMLPSSPFLLDSFTDRSSPLPH